MLQQSVHVMLREVRGPAEKSTSDKWNPDSIRHASWSMPRHVNLKLHLLQSG